MPVLVHGKGVRKLWPGKKPSRAAEKEAAVTPEAVTIALINNMADSALEDTEFQFSELLNNACGASAIHVKLYSLPNISRNDRGRQHFNTFYCDIGDLFNERFDGVIITGTEPAHTDLRDEPYWGTLTAILDWAERSTSSTILSCLAAHAGVLHSDGIPRHRLADKQFGVFNYSTNRAHFLTHGIPHTVHTPHSRWNDVREDALVGAGYTILTSSAHAGVNSFVKHKRKSLFVHFQGHPEYCTETLLKEYRRDVKRFLRHETERYPSMPRGYLNSSVSDLLADFKQKVLSDPREEQMETFPEALVAKTLLNTWSLASAELYRNWLEYLVSRKSGAAPAGDLTRMSS